MKKILLASTALVAMTGAAVAQVSFSGYGRFGAAYRENQSAALPTGQTDAQGNPITQVQDTPDLALVSRFRLNIDGKAVTDGGVEFSARVRLQADDTPNVNEQLAAGLNGARYTVQYGGLRVDAGNVGGAFDNLANYYGYEPGLEAFTGQYVGVNYGFLGYSSGGAGANALYFSYTAGGFVFGASYDQQVVFNPAAGATDSDNADRWDIGASYNFNNYTIGIAYGETNNPGGSNPSFVVATLAADFDRWGVVGFIGDESDVGANVDGTVYGISASFDVGAATQIIASYGDGDGSGDTQGFGIGARYDLGGGVSLRGGIGQTKVGNGNSQTVGDIGVIFNF